MKAALLGALLAAAPPTLGDALRAIGAFEAPPPPPPALDPALAPPPPPPRTGAKLLLGAGGALVLGGLVGMIASPHCATRDADGRCVDARGADDIYPALLVLGLATAITGSYWYRQEVPARADQ